MNDTSIKVKNLTKIYKLYDNPIDRLKESMHPFRRKYHKSFYALNKVSFEIKKGEAVGIIGRNGAGKSTLLKIIAGILSPTSGTVEKNGKVSALLELGSGFNPELSGIENIYFNGLVMGYSREKMDSKIDDILKFADIGDFVHQPIKTYSSGMNARLAFAVSAIIDPEILIIDEILSVGDLDFQVKSMNKIRDLMNRCTVIFVSHDLEAVKEICNRAFLIDNGGIEKSGKAKEVIKYYHRKISNNAKIPPAIKEPVKNKINIEAYKENKKFLEVERFEDSQRFGDKKVLITNVEIIDDDNNTINTVALMQKVRIRVHLKFYVSTGAFNVGFHCQNINGSNIFGLRTNEMMADMPYKRAGENGVVEFLYHNKLRPGVYSLSVAVSNRFKVDEPEYHDWINAAITFKTVCPENTVWGIFYESTGEVIVR